MRAPRVLLATLCCLAAMPLACGLDRSGTLPADDHVPPTGGSGGSGAAGAHTGTGAGGTGAGGTGTGGTGGQILVCEGAYECVPSPAGAVHLVVDDGGGCPSGWDTPHTLYEDNAPGCTDCACGPPSGSCTSGTVIRYTDTGCGDVIESLTVAHDTCTDVVAPSDQQADGYEVEAEPVETACVASGGTKTDLAEQQACEYASPSTADCVPGNVCVPSVDPLTPRCVLVSGHGSCPPDYPISGEFYDNGSDTLSCDCACSDSTGSSCDGAFAILRDHANCGGWESDTFWAGATCWDASDDNNHSSFYFNAGTYSPGICTPLEQHSGQLTFSDPVTLCCQQ